MKWTECLLQLRCIIRCTFIIVHNDNTFEFFLKGATGARGVTGRKGRRGAQVCYLIYIFIFIFMHAPTARCLHVTACTTTNIQAYFWKTTIFVLYQFLWQWFLTLLIVLNPSSSIHGFKENFLVRKVKSAFFFEFKTYVYFISTQTGKAKQSMKSRVMQMG